MSIGYSVPASIGVALANEDKRVIVLVGDGAFQMTAQAVSTLLRNKLNPIIFIFNNKGYTIVRLFKEGAYNDIKDWQYSKVPEIFGGDGWGCMVRTGAELLNAIKEAESNKESLAMIEVELDEMDSPASLRGILKC